MKFRFQVHTKIGKPIGEVFDGVRNPAKLSKYFTTGGASGPLKEGATVNWSFKEPAVAPFPVHEVFAQLGRVAYTVEYLAYRLSNLGMNLEPEFHDCLATCRVGRTGAYLYVIVL